ncbi:DUF6781 family protein [Rugosibacter aromaticivorans]|uniref:DUF6781 family protein n=1 Tax=Rugosibacter aromaticivorans TaxID=1565605 RepID=UPI0011F9DC95|nr:DUF6781 family protein [Rugosibacter aromaticivorans]TBR13936.1 MAG: hypothetical protein EPO43_08910 [Rugosibacter sp.]
MATQNKDEQNDVLESRVRQAVAQGADVQAAVRQLTLDAMSSHTLSLESISRIMHAVVQGTREGVQEELDKTTTQVRAAQIRMKEAVSGLDTALAQFAAATKLAVEEAAGRAQKFSSQDMARTRADLESLESLFLETMKTSATATRGVASDMLADMVSHAQRTGTAVGEQIKATLETFTQQMTAVSKTQIEAGMQLAQTTADVMRKVAAGMLSGLADRVKPSTPSPSAPSSKASRSKGD